MPALDLLAGSAVGLLSGVSSGLLGVSPGGALVVFSVLLLGTEQHVAQGISLFAQIPPTSLAGIRQYLQGGHRAPIRWLVWLGLGYTLGGILGALAASHVSENALQWAYVVYLASLDALLIFRGRREGTVPSSDAPPKDLHGLAFLTVGLVAGISSGFLGIGGGLATTVGLTAALRVPQHQAQLVSLIMAVVPATAVPAWIYSQQGWGLQWPIIAGTIAGLLIGTGLGASVATHLSKNALYRALVFFVTAMTVYMIVKAVN